jgi:hypothetical protein
VRRPQVPDRSTAARSEAQHDIGAAIGNGDQSAFAAAELSPPERAPQALCCRRRHSVAVDFPVGAQVAQESAPFRLGQCLPAALGVRTKRIDHASPVETRRLSLADLGAQPHEKL